MKKEVVIFDLDGTLSDGTHRLHLLPSAADRHNDAAWVLFNMASEHDSPIRNTIDICNRLADTYDVIILTGRGEVARGVTVRWLESQGVKYDRLIMRKKGDCRTDIEYKTEAIDKIGKDNIVCCFDDLEHIVKAFRGLGLTCYQVTSYDTPTLDVAPPNQGMKYDADKPKFDLLFDGCPDALTDIALALTMGAKKYAAHTWQTVPHGEERYKAALIRHLIAYSSGEVFDKESGLCHLAHAATNALFILQLYHIREKQNDSTVNSKTDGIGKTL